MKSYICTIIVFLLFCNFLHGEEYRAFVGSNGTKIEARFISYDPDSEIVKIELKNKKMQNVKLSLFSEQDQRWIKEGGKEAEDNPFDVSEGVLTGPLRIILNIDESGVCRYRIEKALEPYKSDFVGKAFEIGFLPKTKALRDKDGQMQISYNFSDSDPLTYLSHPSSRKNVVIDNQKGGPDNERPRPKPRSRSPEFHASPLFASNDSSGSDRI